MKYYEFGNLVIIVRDGSRVFGLMNIVRRLFNRVVDFIGEAMEDSMIYSGKRK